MAFASRRKLLQSAGAVGAAAMAAWRVCPAQDGPAADGAGAARPNILFILMDDMGPKDTSGLGSDFYETPNIDRLAREGMVFRGAYANAPNCAPTRACLMSGQYTPRHGIYTVGTSARPPAERRKLIPTKNTTVLPSGTVTVAEVLKEAGYVTFHGGKWHIGSGAETGPEGQGFDVNVGGFSAGSPPGGYFAPWKGPGLENAPKGVHLCDFITDQAIGFIRGHKDKSFFAYVPFYDVHTPLQAKPELKDKYDRKLAALEAEGRKTEHNNTVYAAMMENSDMNIGRLLAALDDLDLAKNTVVIFSSDNGGYGGATSQRPLRGCKGMIYEGGVRVPGIVRWPERVKAGSVCDVPVITMDFYPTLAELAGGRLPENQPIDGRSIVPLLTGAGAFADRPLFWHLPIYLGGVHKGFEQDSHDGFWRGTPSGAIRLGDWKLIEFFENGGLELYNLKDDPGERRNLAGDHPEKVTELREAMLAWRRQINAPVPSEPEPAYDANAAGAPPKGGRADDNDG